MTCKICLAQWPLADHRIADCGLTVAYLHEDQFFPGWTVLALKQHATELFQLSEEERRQVIEEVTRVARALADVFQPVKINYACLGNQLPHMHWHVVPRLRADPAPMEAIWGVKHEPKRLAAAEIAERLSLIRGKLR
jgi:diadenosine tetraphosphate (Ap4A) HIT family hydrolase